MTQRACSLRRRRSNGFTLLELLLVILVILTIAALAVPNLGKTVTRYQLRSAADAVRADWGRARMDAIRSGQIHLFYYVPQSGRYVVTSSTGSEQFGITAAPPGQMQTEQTQTAQYAQGGVGDTGDFSDRIGEQVIDVGANVYQQRTLDSDVFFLTLDAQGNLLSAELPADTELQQVGGAETLWSEPIVFYPDGTTSQATVVLGNRSAQAIEISLRSLTGTAQVSDVMVIGDLR